MKLSQLLSALQNPEMIQLVLMDHETDSKIVDMNAATWESLDDTIENRVVKKWQIASQTKIIVTLEAAVTVTPEEETPAEEPVVEPSEP